MAPQIAATPASHSAFKVYFSFTVLSKLRQMLPLRLYRKPLIIVLIKVTNEYCHVLLAYVLTTQNPGTVRAVKAPNTLYSQPVLLDVF